MNTQPLERKIQRQRNELRMLNERNRTLTAKLQILNDIDYFKSRLNIIAPNVPYKKAIGDKRLQRQIEHIFNLPFSECLDHYKTLLDKRNEIAHRFTRLNWQPSDTYKRRITKKTLEQLSAV